MKNLTIAILLISVLGLACIRIKRQVHSSTIITQTESKGFPFMIKNHKLGTIMVGDGIDTTLRNLTTWFRISNDSIPTSEGGNEYLKIFRVFKKDNNEFLFSIEPGYKDFDKDKVFRMITSYKLFKTSQEVKVGMTIKNVKKACEITELDKSGEEGFHIFIKDFDGSLGIESPNVDNWWQITLKTLPDSLKVTEIVIV